MRKVKIPIAHWHCILTERERKRWGGGERMERGRDGEIAVERERGGRGRQKGSCKVFLFFYVVLWLVSAGYSSAEYRGT